MGMSSYETDGNRLPRAHALAQAMVKYGGSVEAALNEMTQPASAGAPLRHPKIDQSTIQSAIHLLNRQGYEGHASTLSEYEDRHYPKRGRSF